MADSRDQGRKLAKDSTPLEQQRAHNQYECGLKREGSNLAGHRLPKSTSESSFVAPNGGYKAWAAVAGGFLCQFASFGFLNVLGIFQTRYQEENLSKYSSSSISWIFTFQLFLMFLFAQADGMFVDMFGPRAVMIPSAILELIGIAMLAICERNQYYQFFLAQGVCFGVGSAGLFMPGLIIAGQYFTTNRGLAVGIVASGASVGGVVFPFALNSLFRQVGFTSALRWTLLMLGLPLILAVLLISSPMEPKGWSEGKKSLVGLKVFRKKSFLLFTLGGFLFYWGLFAPFDYLPAFAMGVTNPDLALYTVSIINASSVFGRIIPSYVADRIGSLLTMSIMAFATALTVLLCWLPVNFFATLTGTIIFTVLYGFTSGAFVSLMTPSLVQLCDGQIGELGIMLGTFMAINSFACLTGLPIQGALLDSHHGDFFGLILFSGACLLAGSVLITASLFTQKYQAKLDPLPVITVATATENV